MKLRQRPEFTTKRRKTSKKRSQEQLRLFLVWVSALTTVFSLVKLLVEIVQMLH